MNNIKAIGGIDISKFSEMLISSVEEAAAEVEHLLIRGIMKQMTITVVTYTENTKDESKVVNHC